MPKKYFEKYKQLENKRKKKPSVEKKQSSPVSIKYVDSIAKTFPPPKNPPPCPDGFIGKYYLTYSTQKFPEN